MNEDERGFCCECGFVLDYSETNICWFCLRDGRNQDDEIEGETMKTIIRKYLTLRVISDAPTEMAIDDTIKRGLDQWRERPLVVDVQLHAAVPVFRSDDQIFVTMIFDVELE